MNLRRAGGRAILTLCVGSIATSALAQIAPPGRVSSNAVFGRPANQAGDAPTLDLTGSLYGGYDDDIAAALSGRPTAGRPTNSPGGALTGGSTSLNFSSPGPRTTLSTRGRANINHFPTTGATSAAYAADLNLGHQVTQSLGLELAGRVEYAPYYGLGTRLFAPVTDFGLPVVDDGLQDLDQISASAYIHYYHVGVNHQVSRRASVDAVYRFRRTDFGSVSRDLAAHDATVRLSRQLARFCFYGCFSSTLYVAVE